MSFNREFQVSFVYHISIVSPSCAMDQKAIPFSSVNSFMRQALSNPLATKCMGTKVPTLKRSMNCLAPRVYPLPMRASTGNITISKASVIFRISFNQSEFLRDNGSTLIIVVKEAGIPVVKVARMEDFPVRNLYNP